MDSSEKYGREYEFREVPLFQTPEEIKSKKGVHRSHRFAYLQRLVNEFQETEDIKAKQEILAHLANFAYDSVNYEYLRQLHVIDLFLDMLIEEDIELKRFGIGGLCNCCIDPKNIEIILKPENKGLLLIKKCLSSSDEETVLSAITTLFYLLNPTTAPSKF